MSKIKECFTSRWADGVLLEADFSQLEVAVLAILSNDPVLIDDLLSGRDLHKMRAAELFKIPESAVTPSQRTLAKRLSFQLQYGAGAKSMAEKNGIDISISKLFIKNYYERYEEVKRWQDDVMATVKASRTPTGGHTPFGYPQGEGVYRAATGRMYKFREYDAPPWALSDDPTFSPTEMKNYPVQGTATGDFMALFRGRVWRRLIKHESLRYNVLPINTVHDSIMYDCKSEEYARVLNEVLQEEAAKLPATIEQLWGIKCAVPMPIESKVGPSWASLKKLED